MLARFMSMLPLALTLSAQPSGTREVVILWPN
jgi:hypothetical protein